MRLQNLWTLILAASVSLLSAGETDVKGAADHPLFNRMPGFYIRVSEQRDFHRFEFSQGARKPKLAVEGKYTRLDYQLKKGEPAPGGVAIARNYLEAIKAVGGTLVAKNISGDQVVLSLVRQGQETWVDVNAAPGGKFYSLRIIEKAAMVQVIQADAMFKALSRDGYIAMDVRFDLDRATLTAEAKPQVEQMALLLQKHPELKVSVDGHTDGTGDPAHNRSLSEARAKTVLEALVTAGISRGRLSAKGWGADRAVADNRTEEGRGKNRRVELVKQ